MYKPCVNYRTWFHGRNSHLKKMQSRQTRQNTITTDKITAQFKYTRQ